MDVDGFDASFAFDVTAPVEFALAAFFDRRFVSVVTSAAAHQIAAVHSSGCPVARPSISSFIAQYNRLIITVTIFSWR